MGNQMNSTPTDEAMNLLNEASRRFPDAISLMAGRPPQWHLDASETGRWLRDFVEQSATTSDDAQRHWTELGQYSDTSGTIRNLAAEYLRRNGIPGATADACMMTNGAQEALAICLAGLTGPGRVAFTTDPSYVGFSGAARVLGVPLESAPDELFLEQLRLRLCSGGPPIGCVYAIPDFSNPTARTMTLDERMELLALAAEHDFTIIEDAAYRHYRFRGVSLPTLKALDGTGHVVYVESFAKTVLPGLRLAVMMADRRGASGMTLADRLSWIKSYLSVASSPLTQAMLGGLLSSSDYRLDRFIEPRRATVQRNCEAMCAALEREFGHLRASGVDWRRPDGGFFLTMALPFPFDEARFMECAQEYRVLVMPMRLFSSSGRCDRQIRLAFSNATPAAIDEGVARLARYVAGRCRSASTKETA
ncbi:PLP-dependent aminotransferase family protein [Accumulibacter sp.]|uniref:aminotransferase-like domain-containing protein n=1 Tax=Accumulibacter sp. TaxID=2053492 RepID=UPI0035AF4C57